MADGTVLDAIIKSLVEAAGYDKNDQAAPAAVLWPDKNRDWETVAARLRSRLPLLTLDVYSPGLRSGPAIWLRCAIAGQIDGLSVDDGDTPIVYCPGVSRDELRSLQDLGEVLQPAAELQYRSAWWTHPNGRDWTLAAFLGNKQKGLGLELKDDSETAAALSRAIKRILDEPVDSLCGRQLGPEDFDSLLNPDSKRSILLWLNDTDGFRAGRDDGEWGAFAASCRKDFGFDPDSDGPLTAAALLGGRDGAWAAVWERFTEAAQSYPEIPRLLDQARPQELILARPDSWPSVNDEQEGSLRASLCGLANAQPGGARNALGELEAHHGERRAWIWSRLGRAPLAEALGHLLVLADASAGGWQKGGPAAIAAQYVDFAWRADDALLQALAAVDRVEDIAAVKAAADVLYRVWLEDGAKALQEAVAATALAPALPGLNAVDEGTCVLFSDGLRMDVAHRLRQRLEAAGGVVALEADFVALPPVTATAKPAVSPVASELVAGPEFSPSAPQSQGRLTADGLRKLLKDAGWQVLGDENGDHSGRAWTECGDVDTIGHSQGAKLAKSLDMEIEAIAQRVEALLAWGWQRVVVVTDHGWLLVPGGLQKVELPEHLTEQRKGRCARLKPEVSPDFLTLPWRWDPAVNIAYAPGISTFVAGAEYEHGGISPQECITPRLTVTREDAATSDSALLGEPTWAGLRCRTQVEGAPDGAAIDLRSKAAEAASSVLVSPVPVKGAAASVLVTDEGLEGSAILLVLLDAGGSVLKQRSTVVGGEE